MPLCRRRLLQLSELPGAVLFTSFAPPYLLSFSLSTTLPIRSFIPFFARDAVFISEDGAVATKTERKRERERERLENLAARVLHDSVGDDTYALSFSPLLPLARSSEERPRVREAFRARAPPPRRCRLASSTTTPTPAAAVNCGRFDRPAAGVKMLAN